MKPSLSKGHCHETLTTSAGFNDIAPWLKAAPGLKSVSHGAPEIWKCQQCWKDLIYFLQDGDEQQKTSMKKLVDEGLTIGGGSCEVDRWCVHRGVMFVCFCFFFNIRFKHTKFWQNIQLFLMLMNNFNVWSIILSYFYENPHRTLKLVNLMWVEPNPIRPSKLVSCVEASLWKHRMWNIPMKLDLLCRMGRGRYAGNWHLEHERTNKQISRNINLRKHHESSTWWPT